MNILIDLRKWLDDSAEKIAQEEADPERWDTPILYLLEALEYEAIGHQEGLKAYNHMLQKVRDSLTDRLEDRTWGY